MRKRKKRFLSIYRPEEFFIFVLLFLLVYLLGTIPFPSDISLFQNKVERLKTQERELNLYGHLLDDCYLHNKKRTCMKIEEELQELKIDYHKMVKAYNEDSERVKNYLNLPLSYKLN